VPSGGVFCFEKQVDKVLAHRQLREQIKPLMTLPGQLNAQIEALDEQLAQQALQDQVAQRLCTVPGVGPVATVYFISIIDQVERFSCAHELEFYLGLASREFNSGENRFRGRITKTGDRRLRNLLVEAAWCIVCRPRPETKHLLLWTGRIATRHEKT
jgi:transposase